jgi:hypothetical protein
MLGFDVQEGPMISDDGIAFAAGDLGSSASSESLSSTSESLSDLLSSSSDESIGGYQCESGDRYVELVPQFQKKFTVNYTHGYRIKIVAQNACNMEAEIFRIYRYPTDRETGSPQDEFTGVCSWVDMEELPKNAPRDTDCPRAYRRAYLDVVVDTEAIASDLWEKVKEEVDQLVATINAGDTLEVGDSHWAGGEPVGA